MALKSFLIAVTALILSSTNVSSSSIVIVDNDNPYAFWGLYRTSQMTDPGWDLFQSTIDWAAPGANSVVLFTYNGTLDSRISAESDGLATYNYLTSVGYSVTVESQTGITSGDYSGYDLAIYHNALYGQDPTNLLSQNVSFITTAVAHTVEMGIGSGVQTAYSLTDTSYILNNSHPITSGYPLGAFTLDSEMYMYGTEALGNSTVLITSEAPSAVPVPAAVWLFGSGLIGLIGVARRKKA